MEFKASRGPRVILDPTSVMDIGSLHIANVDISPGRAIPDDGDPRIEHSLQGFLFTCGPDHIRHPEPLGDGLAGKYPLHGSFSSHPAEIISVGENDGNAECLAHVKVTCADGGTALLERLWRIDGNTGEVQLRDKVTNTGMKPFPAMLMYHINIAARLFDGDTRLSGAMLEGGGFPWTFGEQDGGIFCVPAGRGGWAEVRLGPIEQVSGLSLKIRFRTDTLPYLQVWRNQKDPANVLGIEPVSHRRGSRSELEAAGELEMLAPGAAREYGLSFAFILE